MDYYKKYLKYKTKYFKLLGGSKGTYDIESNSCIWSSPKSGEPKDYYINFLWLSRDLETSRSQKYVIPFGNEDILGIKIIKLEYIIHFFNIIRWTQLNPRATIFFWHDSTEEIVENTRRLIIELLKNNELILLLELVDKIIRISNNLQKLNGSLKVYGDDEDKDKLVLIEFNKIICDELTTRFLRYKIEYKSDSPSKIDDINFTEEFIDLVKHISELITLNDETGLINVNSGTPILDISLDKLHFRSILELKRLQQLEDTGKYLIQYFGLNQNNTIIGRYLSTTTAGVIKVSINQCKLEIGKNLDYIQNDKIFAVDKTNPKKNFRASVISYNKQTGELLIDIIDKRFENIYDNTITYKVSKIELSVYVKVDFVRLLILMQEISNNPDSYAIYADLDSHGLDESFIFNEESMRLLDAHGLVLPLGQKLFYENSFHILAGENLTCDNYMIIAIQKILIDFNIQKIIYSYTLEPEEIFNIYGDMLIYYLILRKIKVSVRYHPIIYELIDDPRYKDLFTPLKI